MYTIERLLKDIEIQKTAFFIGAGAARCSLIRDHQLPDGNEMKLGLYRYRYGNIAEPTLRNYEKMFKKEFGIRGSIQPEMVWEKCLSESGQQLTPYIKLLENMFTKEKYIPPNYKFMAWLHFTKKINQIITTNFDEKIEEAYKLLQSRGLYNNITVFSAVDDEDFIHFSKEPKDTRVIYKLHGTISRPFTIRSSLTDMKKGLSDKKYSVLKKIFENNTLIVFVGYACNDNDIFKALKKISREVHDVKIVWIKRKGQINKNSNIYKILSAFNSTDNVLPIESYNFFKILFDNFVDREDIHMDLIKSYVNFMKEKVLKDTERMAYFGKKEPIPDILYGKIKFPDNLQSQIFKIINTFDMQRLRDIKQLSFAQYKYPSATHTRFSHSLGVAHLVAKVLTENPYFKEKVNEEDKKNTVYAALLHDVGHGPLGHVLDKFYDRLQKGNEHEKFTREFIDKGLIDLSETLKKININFSDVEDRVVFKSENKEELKRNAEKVFLAWLITDYALDLDRIDFLLRDLLVTQYKCKSKLPTKIQRELFPQERHWQETLNDIINDFISRLRIGKIDELSEAEKHKFPNNARILYIDYEGKYNLNTLIDFLLGVYTEMYLNVYYHDIVSSAEAMMAKALHIAYDTVDIDRTRLYTFTDSELFSYLENLENDLVREIVYSVKHRRLFRSVVKFDIDTQENISAIEIERKIAEKFNLDQNNFKSLVIVNIPRKKKLKNLFIKERDGKIISYPNLQHFEEKLSEGIKGKVFVHPRNKLYNKENRQKLADLLKSIGTYAEPIPEEIKDTTKQPEKKLTLFEFDWR